MHVILLVFALNVYPAVTKPVHHPRANSDKSNFISPNTWIPIVVVVLVLVLAALVTYSKDSLQKAVAVFGEAYGGAHVGAPLSSNPRGAGRELTAEQLVGSINGTDLPTSATTRQTRRTRRAWRTPSQISVTSLPAYNKEPGEEELVIFRGRDMEDATMPAAMVATPAGEDDSSLNSQDHSQVSRYSHMPLLRNDDASGDLLLQSLRSVDEDVRRPSFDSLQETSSLMRVDGNLPQGGSDPRGDTPPYFEVVVDHTPEFDSEAPATQTSSSTSPEPQRTRSGFRTFLNRMSMRTQAPEHRRMESNQSVATSNVHSNAHRSERSTPTRTSNHRATPSSSGSLASSMFRTISRQRSNPTLNGSAALNLPSVISLNSISSPLSHTLIRTEFTYPKSGPTPEQLKVISSRENFSRFGMPYGADAIAFAASSSRQDFEPPPPDFDASSSQLSLVRPSLPRLDSSGNVADTREGRPSISEPILGGAGAEHNSETRSSQPLSVDTQSTNVANTSTPPIRHAAEPSTIPSTSKIPSPISPADPSPSSTPKLPPLSSIIGISEFGQLYTSPNSLTPKHATGLTTRSGSIASNCLFQSYATATESLGISTDSGPSTPRLENRAMTEALIATTG